MSEVIRVNFGKSDDREDARYAALAGRATDAGSSELGTTEEWALTALSFLKVRFCEDSGTTMMFVPKVAVSCVAIFFEEMAERLGIIGNGKGAA